MTFPAENKIVQRGSPPYFIKQSDGIPNLGK
jgi:hypothetical protein